MTNRRAFKTHSLCSLILAFTLALAMFPCAAQNVLVNPGFEDGTTGWTAWGSGTFTSSTALSHTGSRAALVANRTGTSSGVAQSILGLLQTNITYRVSAWVRVLNGDYQNAQLTIRKIDGSGTSYLPIATGTVRSNSWTQLLGDYTLNVVGNLTALNLYIEGPSAGVSYYADDVVLEISNWKAEANARIEQIRKSNARLLVVDGAGDPVTNATVAIKQTKHRFGFGSAINFYITNANYAAFFRTNFEWAVMENESKWYENEVTRSNITYAVADSIVNFCATNDITLRGHTIFWAVDDNVQSWVQNLSTADLRIHLTNRIESVVNHFKGTFKHWDVNNEMLHGNYFGNRLGNSINSWMFKHARLQDSNVVLFVNDYNVIAGDRTAEYKSQIQGLISAGAPVGGIGVQGHFGEVVNASPTEARLDSLAQLNLPIWVTEYDSRNNDATNRANNLETLYRIAFSKPAVDGVLMWGFWAGAHWLGGQAAIVDMDWTINAAGKRYQALLKEWTTITNGVTGTGGALDFRGFHGNYDITITPPDGAPIVRHITLDPGAGTNIFTLVAAPGGAKPLLLNPRVAPPDGSFHFQITGDAERTFAIETSNDLSGTNWSTITNLFNPSGTISFTNSAPQSATQQFFRAVLLP